MNDRIGEKRRPQHDVHASSPSRKNGCTLYRFPDQDDAPDWTVKVSWITLLSHFDDRDKASCKVELVDGREWTDSITRRVWHALIRG